MLCCLLILIGLALFIYFLVYGLTAGLLTMLVVIIILLLAELLILLNVYGWDFDGVGLCLLIWILGLLTLLVSWELLFGF